MLRGRTVLLYGKENCRSRVGENGTCLDTCEHFMTKSPQQAKGMNEISLKVLLYCADSQKYLYKFPSHEKPQNAPSYLATRYCSKLETSNIFDMVVY